MNILEKIQQNGDALAIVSLNDLREFAQDLLGMKAKTEKDNAENQMLTQREAAAYLCKSVATLIRWENEGYLLPSCRVGRTPYYSRQKLDALRKG